MFVLVIAAPIVILNRILRHESIGRETILGAICVYVLLGIVFAGIYGAINDIDGGDFFAQRACQSNVDFLYFSFVVLTTLGFGDLTPGPTSRACSSTFEALIGQIFLVTLVARLMALYGLERRQPATVTVDADDAQRRTTPAGRDRRRRRLRARGGARPSARRSAPRPCAGCRR